MNIFPKKIDFFEIFDKSLENLVGASKKLVEMVKNAGDFEKNVKEVQDFEHLGDILTHDIMKELHKTFLTPIDREDIHALASRIDDVLDLIWGGVDRMSVYKVCCEPTNDVIALAEDLEVTTEMLQKAFKELRAKNYSHVQEYCIEINRLENRIDRKFRDALGKLVNESNDAVYIIKWKDIYQLLEDASDRCEDIANILEGIVLKNA